MFIWKKCHNSNSPFSYIFSLWPSWLSSALPRGALTASSAQTVSDNRGLGDHPHPEAAWRSLEAEWGGLGCPADWVRGIPGIQWVQTGQASLSSRNNSPFDELSCPNAISGLTLMLMTQTLLVPFTMVSCPFASPSTESLLSFPCLLLVCTAPSSPLSLQ